MKRKTQTTTVPEISASIHQLFDFARYPVLKQHLWAWLKTTVTGNFNTSLEESERAFIMELYEKLEKLLEAADKYYIRENGAKVTRSGKSGNVHSPIQWNTQ